MIKKIIDWFKCWFKKEEEFDEDHALDMVMNGMLEDFTDEEIDNIGKEENGFDMTLIDIKPYPSTPGAYIEPDPKFRILVAYKNGGRWVRDCARSIQEQTEEFTAHFLDDNSTDDCSDLIPEDFRFEKTIREYRHWSLENQVQRLLIDDFNDDDIIVFVDGDDKLTPNALTKLKEIYDTEQCLVCYGQYEISSGGSGGCRAYTEEEFENIREHTFRTSHVRSFKYKLFKELLRQDPELKCFLDDDMGYYRMGGDVAMMYPILEIAGFENVYFNKDVLYWYRKHMNNDIALNPQMQKNIENKIKSKKSFDKL